MRLRLDDSSWPAGTTVRVAVPNAPVRQVTAVPREVLVLRTDGISVLKIDDNGKAVKVAVKTGVAADDMMDVVGGETRD